MTSKYKGGFIPKPDVDMHGNCSACGGVHYGTGNVCVYKHTPKPLASPEPDQPNPKESVLRVYPEAYCRARPSGMIDLMDNRSDTAMAIGCGNSDAAAWTDAANLTGLSKLAEPVATPELCGEVVCHLIAGASWFVCARPKHHDGGHRAAGNCFAHEPYLGMEGQPPQCPEWPKCISRAYATGSQPPAPLPESGEPDDNQEDHLFVLGKYPRAHAFMFHGHWVTMKSPIDARHFTYGAINEAVAWNHARKRVEYEHELASLRERLGERDELRGFSEWLTREQWGFVLDGLIEHAATLRKRKGINQESTADETVQQVEDTLRLIGDHASKNPWAQQSKGASK